LLKVESVSVVLPVHNQADHIELVLNEYIESLQRLSVPFELLPVVNGPRRDESLEICRRIQERCGRIRTVCIEETGWGHAVRAGLAQANGDLVCYTNSARTTGKDLLLLLLYGVAHSDCVIKANRKIRESAGRRLGSLLYNLECRSLFDLPYWDINGTPKVFHRELGKLLALTRNDDLIDLEFNAICRAEGYQVIELPIFSSSRRSGKSTTNWRSAFRMYWGAWRLRKLIPPHDAEGRQ
jgi:glycosyltransferase involved in cell wall biosynthesis